MFCEILEFVSLLFWVFKISVFELTLSLIEDAKSLIAFFLDSSSVLPFPFPYKKSVSLGIERNHLGGEEIPPTEQALKKNEMKISIRFFCITYLSTYHATDLFLPSLIILTSSSQTTRPVFISVRVSKK